MFDIMNLSPLSIKILVFLARSPDDEFYVREIAEITKSSVGGCHKVLTNLSNFDLITRRKSGKNVYHKANTRNPSLKHLKIFVNILEIKDIVDMIKDNSRKVVLFGSCSTGEDITSSDVDLFVLTEKTGLIKNALRGQFVNDRKVNALVLSPHRYITLKEKDPVLFKELTVGVTLWREVDE